MNVLRFCINSTIGNIFIITIVGFSVYSNTFNSPFVYDDISYISENAAIKDLRYFYDPSMLKDVELAGFVASNFNSRLVGYFTFALNYRIHGLNVTGYHAINLLVHLATSLLVYYMVLLTLKTPFFEPAGKNDEESPNPLYGSNVIAVFTSLLFVSHPIQTQAITFITQRFASLASMFYLLSFVLYIKWRIDKKPDNKSLIFSVLSAVLAMKTKEISFTLPVVITIYEFMFFKGDIKKRALYLIPFLLTMLIIPLAVLGTKSNVLEINRISESLTGETNIAIEYLYTQFRVIVTYIRLLFIPMNQSIEYDYPVYKTFLDPNVYISLLFLLSVIGTGVYLWHRSDKKDADCREKPLRLISFGIFWFFVTLSVESSIMPLLAVIYEHRLYLPSVGFFAAIMGIVLVVLNKYETLRKAVIPGLTLVIIALSFTTYTRNLVWQDDIKLWSDAVTNNPNSRRALFNLGISYYRKGSIDEASKLFLLSSKKHPEYLPQHFDLGKFFEKYGRLDDAVGEYLAIIKIDPDNVAVHLSLARLYEKQGLFPDAVREFRTVLKLDPNYSIVHVAIAVLYGKTGNLNEAIKEYKMILQHHNYAVAHNNLAELYVKKGMINEAIKEYEACLKINSNYPDALKKVNLLYKLHGTF